MAGAGAATRTPSPNTPAPGRAGGAATFFAVDIQAHCVCRKERPIRKRDAGVCDTWACARPQTKGMLHPCVHVPPVPQPTSPHLEVPVRPRAGQQRHALPQRALVLQPRVQGGQHLVQQRGGVHLCGSTRYGGGGTQAWKGMEGHGRAWKRRAYNGVQDSYYCTHGERAMDNDKRGGIDRCHRTAG